MATDKFSLLKKILKALGLSDDRIDELISWIRTWLLDDAGFHYSALCKFRARLLEGSVETQLFDQLLTILKERRLLLEKGKQRTDSTHICGALRTLNRLELVG